MFTNQQEYSKVFLPVLCWSVWLSLYTLKVDKTTKKDVGEEEKKAFKGRIAEARRPAVRLISKQVPASTEGQKRPKRPQHSSVTEVLHNGIIP